MGESATSRVCFLPLASGLAARTRQAAWGCLAVESSLWELRSSSRVGLVREPNCSDINKKICCGLYNSQQKPQSGFFPVVDVDMRLPHPQQLCWISSVDLSVLSLLWATPVYRRGCCLCRIWYMGFNQIFPQLPATSPRSQLNYSMFLVMDGLYIEAVLL